jgi:hypothetical protein
LQVPSFAAFDAPAVPEDPDVLEHRRLTATEFFIKLVQIFFHPHEAFAECRSAPGWAIVLSRSAISRNSSVLKFSM